MHLVRRLSSRCSGRHEPALGAPCCSLCETMLCNTSSPRKYWLSWKTSPPAASCPNHSSIPLGTCLQAPTAQPVLTAQPCNGAQPTPEEREQPLLMGIAHRSLPHFGVQFHPESVATGFGPALLRNFRDLTAQFWGIPEQAPVANLAGGEGGIGSVPILGAEKNQVPALSVAAGGACQPVSPLPVRRESWVSHLLPRQATLPTTDIGVMIRHQDFASSRACALAQLNTNSP